MRNESWYEGDDECDISVIMPSHNEERYIAEALDSIFFQSASAFSFEVLLIDDESSDRTVAAAAGRYGDDARFRLLSGGGNGVSHARNTGLRHARGKYILFCDADDRLASGAMRKLLAQAERTGADMVIGGMRIFHTFGSSVPEAPLTLAGMTEGIERFHPLLYRTMMATGKLYRRAFLENMQIRFLPLAYAEDAAFYMECVMAGGCIVGCGGAADEDRIVYEYRRRTFMEPASVTQRYQKHLWDDFMLSNRYIGALIRGNCPQGLLTEYTQGFYQRICENIIRAFWRNYWLCTPALRRDMELILQELRKNLPPSVWLAAAAPKREDHYLGLSGSGLVSPVRQTGDYRHYAVAVLLGEGISGDALLWVMNGLYHQNFPSFCVVMSERQWEQLGGEYREMENIYRTRTLPLLAVRDGKLGAVSSGVRLRADFILPMLEPMGVQNTALSKLVAELLRQETAGGGKQAAAVFANVFDRDMKRLYYRIRCKARYYMPRCVGGLRRLLFPDDRWGYSESLWRIASYEAMISGKRKDMLTVQSHYAVFVAYTL